MLHRRAKAAFESYAAAFGGRLSWEDLDAAHQAAWCAAIQASDRVSVDPNLKDARVGAAKPRVIKAGEAGRVERFDSSDEEK